MLVDGNQEAILLAKLLKCIIHLNILLAVHVTSSAIDSSLHSKNLSRTPVASVLKVLAKLHHVASVKGWLTIS